MKKNMRLTESELNRIVKKIINEEVNATCAVNTQGTLRYQNGKYGMVTADGGFCIVPTNQTTTPTKPANTAPTTQSQCRRFKMVRGEWIDEMRRSYPDYRPTDINSLTNFDMMTDYWIFDGDLATATELSKTCFRQDGMRNKFSEHKNNQGNVITIVGRR